MSYVIRIRRKTGEPVEFRQPHCIMGGTYAVGGTTEAWLNITYNYWKIFRRLFGEDGITTIYGMNVKDARGILVNAVAQLGDAEPDEDYWKASDGNAKKALAGLVELTDRALSDYPDDEMFWEGD